MEQGAMWEIALQQKWLGGALLCKSPIAGSDIADIRRHRTSRNRDGPGRGQGLEGLESCLTALSGAIPHGLCTQSLLHLSIYSVQSSLLQVYTVYIYKVTGKQFLALLISCSKAK
jgi:hypothetical protein